MAEAGNWPQWLPGVALADFCSIQVLLTVARSAGAEVSRGGVRAILARMEQAGCFRESAVGGVFLLRPEVAAMMVTELERRDPGLKEVRKQLCAPGVSLQSAGIGARLAAIALETNDWAGAEAVWRLYSPGELVSDLNVRIRYAEVPTEVRASHPGLSFAAAIASAYGPETGDLDLDQMITALIRDGRTLHGGWNQHASTEAQVIAGTLSMLAEAAIHESVADTQGGLATRTHEELVRVIRDSSLSRAALTARALTLFHSTVALISLFRGDWSRARREAEYALILNEGCGLPGFLAAHVLRSSCAMAGDTQNLIVAEKFFTEHAGHACPPAIWLEPAFHLLHAEAALRTLNRDKARHHLRHHALHAASSQWLSFRPMHAALVSTAAILWDDPEHALAQFDALVPETVADKRQISPWDRLLLRCRTELLLILGADRQAERMIIQLMGAEDDSVSIVPATWFYLCAGRFSEALAKADEGIFERRVSLTDRAFLHAAKSAALQQGRAAEDLVASAATAACVTCAQADTLLPFALLHADVRSHVVTEHARHHGIDNCFLGQAVRRGAFNQLRDGTFTVAVPLRLTRREEVLLPLLATAATVQQIADQEYVSVNTVRKQVVSLRQKFGATTRDDLIRRAHEAGLLNRTPKSGMAP